MPKTKNNFTFVEITKLNHKFQKPFILSKYHVLAELLFFYFVMGFLLDIVIFSHNSCAWDTPWDALKYTMPYWWL